MKNIAIYTTPVCTYCRQAKEFFKKNNLTFTEYDVVRDVKRRDEMIQRSGQMGVPVIDIDGTVVIGFNERKMRELLDIK